MFWGFFLLKSLCLIQCHVLKKLLLSLCYLQKTNKLLDIPSLLSSAQGIFWNRDKHSGTEHQEVSQ